MKTRKRTRNEFNKF